MNISLIEKSEVDIYEKSCEESEGRVYYVVIMFVYDYAETHYELLSDARFA